MAVRHRENLRSASTLIKPSHTHTCYTIWISSTTCNRFRYGKRLSPPHVGEISPTYYSYFHLLFFALSSIDQRAKNMSYNKKVCMARGLMFLIFIFFNREKTWSIKNWHTGGKNCSEVHPTLASE